MTSAQGRLKMSLWLTISYTFLIITHLFSGIKYNTGDMLRIFPYFMLCLLLMILGEELGKKIKFSSHIKKIKINLNHIALLSIVGSFSLIFDIIRLNGISFGTRIEDFQISVLGVIGNIFASFGIIAWLSSLYNYLIHRDRISILSYLSILSYVAGGILSAGRQAIILILLSSLIMTVWAIKRKKDLIAGNQFKVKNRKSFGIIIFAVLFIGYFFFISAVRSGILNINSKMNMLEREFNAKISDETLSVVYKIDPLSDIYIESLFYYSHELRRLDLLYQHYDYIPLMGLTQLSYIERRLQWLFGKQADISWKHVEFAIEQKGKFSSHTWGTFISNFIVDFGRFGTLIACFLSGVLIGGLYNSLKKSITIEKVIRHCLILAGIVFSIQFSPFAELIWAMPLIAISFIKINFPRSIPLITYDVK